MNSVRFEIGENHPQQELQAIERRGVLLVTRDDLPEGIAQRIMQVIADRCVAALVPVVKHLASVVLKGTPGVQARRTSEGRTGTDVANTARAATYGMVDTLIVDMDSVLPGFVDDDGAVEFSDTDDAVAYAVVGEIARRVWVNRGTVLAVRRDDVPGGGDLAAILRYSF